MDKLDLSNDEIMVSVWCTSYNQQEYIREAFDSILSQKVNFRYEILIHDDCSTDDTINIINDYRAKYPDIIVPIFEEENQYKKTGFDFYRTRMMPKTRGKYIAFCEVDDCWIDDNKLQTQFDFMEAHPEYSICGSNAKFIDVRTGDTTYFNPLSLKDGDADLKRYFLNVYMHTNTRFFRSDLFKDIFKDFGSAQDIYQKLYLITKGKAYYFTKPMSLYRYWCPNSWTVADNEKLSNLKAREMIDLIKGFVPEHDSGIAFYDFYDKFTGGKFKKYTNMIRSVAKYRILDIKGQHFRKIFNAYFYRRLRKTIKIKLSKIKNGFMGKKAV